MTILVTGGAGFIGSNFILDWMNVSTEPVVNLDALTYAGNLESLQPVLRDSRHLFVHGNITDRALIDALLRTHQPRAVIHFAAESHVDRSIHGPAAFVRTNVDGTFCLLESTRAHLSTASPSQREAFRFLHVSTDEVFGSLEATAAPFTEEHPFQPNSPYAASKAASDHLVRAWHHTYGLPVITTHCSNNYGPLQFPEKLIPLMIVNALSGRPLPVYGDGRQVRDWLYVRDHCAALRAVLERGHVGSTYNIGGWNEQSNIDLVHALCQLLDELRPTQRSYRHLVTHVADRPGHDRRYAIDARKVQRELGWQPAETFYTGIRHTVAWYLANPGWIERVQSGAYREWIDVQYLNRAPA